MGRTIMGYWDCPYCGTKGIKGNVRECPNCGKPRGAGIRFYMKDVNEVVDELPGIKHEPDWYCKYCGSLNPASADTCQSCGSPRSESNLNYFDVRDGNEKPGDDTGGERTVVSEKSLKTEEEEKWQESHQEPGNLIDDFLEKQDKFGDSEEKKGDQGRFGSEFKFLPLKSFVLAGSVIALVAILTIVLMPKAKEYSVTDQYWKRTVTLEQNRLVEESGWDLPSDHVEVLSANREIRTYHSVFDHYRAVSEQKSRQVPDGGHYEYSYSDNGDGTFSENSHWVQDYKTEYYTETHEEPVYRQEPVWDTKYTYTIWRWQYSRTIKSSAHDKEPVDGKYTLRDKERVQEKKTTYHLVLYDGKDKQTCGVDKEVFNNAEVDGKVYGIIAQGKFEPRERKKESCGSRLKRKTYVSEYTCHRRERLWKINTFKESNWRKEVK